MQMGSRSYLAGLLSQKGWFLADIHTMLTTYLLILLDLVVLNDSMSLKQRVFTLFFCGNEYAICTKML
jgi:hypothetical protein